VLPLLHPRVKAGTGVHVRHQATWHEGVLCSDLPNLTIAVRPTFFNIVNHTEAKPCFLRVTYDTLGARGSAVGWGTALQVGRSRVRFPMMSLEFFIDIILPDSIYFIPPHPTSWRSVLILSSHLCLGLPNRLFLSGFPQNPVENGNINAILCLLIGQSQLPHCLRRGSAAARSLGLRVQIPPKAWFLSVVSVVCCAGRNLWDELITCPEEFYRV